MERAYFSVGEPGFMLVNGPLVLFNLAANIFYALCLHFPPRNRPRLKQPLKLLLGFLTWCSLFYSVSLTFLHYLLRRNVGYAAFLGSWLAVHFCAHSSMTCYVWLNFYYCVQIVPARRALLIWLRRNIQVVIYGALLLDGAVSLFGVSVAVTDAVLAGPLGVTYANYTPFHRRSDEVYPGKLANFVILSAHLLACLCLTAVSSFATARYLHTHMRNVARSGASFSTPRLQSQMRVAVTGVSQGVLYLLYDTFYIAMLSLVTFRGGSAPDIWVAFTVTSLYVSGTTVNMGVGQSLYRQTAGDVWSALRARVASAR